MGPLSYTQSVMDQNVLIQCTTTFRSGYVTAQETTDSMEGEDRATEKHTCLTTALMSNKPHTLPQCILGGEAGWESMAEALSSQADFT